MKKGFTLIEVMVAVAVFSVLAILAWKGLETLTRARGQITQLSDGSKALQRCFSQLKLDLSQSIPTQGANVTTVQGLTDGFVVLRNQPVKDELEGVSYQWVRYLYDENQKTISRGIALLPADTNPYAILSPPPQDEFAEEMRTLLSDTDSLSLEGRIGNNWVVLYASKSKDATSGSQLLVGKPNITGFRVVLNRAEGGYTRLIQSSD